MIDDGFETSVTVRIRDLDSMGHVNNAVYATYLEQARNDYFREVLGVSLSEMDSVLASLELDYARSIEAKDDVTVSITITEIGSASLSMAYEIRANGEQAATARTVQVHTDPENGGSRPIPSSWRLRIEHRQG
ncbi:acyl-CoA thioesterase [Natrinema halophilum]|nr:acyl-CoA thioesterase [Natrinema halophilum]